MRRTRVLSVAGVLAVLGGVAVYLSGALDRGEAAAPYRVVAAQSGPLVSVISASGSLKPRTIVTVGPSTPGQVKEVLVDFNSTVQAGDPLARLDPDMAQARVAMARADLDVANGAVEIARAEMARADRSIDNAKATVQGAHADVEHAQLTLTDAARDLKRKQELTATGDASRVEQEHATTAAGQANSGVASARAHELAAAAAQAGAQAESAVAQAQLRNALATVTAREAALQQAELDLADTVLRAPISGVVVDRNVVVGQSVAPGPQTVLFSIAADLGALEVHASIDEADIGRVQPGQQAALTFDAYPGQQFAGRVLDVHKMPEVVQGVVSYDVVISADNSAHSLLPGMTADVRIVAGETASTLKVPDAALRFRPKDAPLASRKHGHEAETAARGLGAGGGQPAADAAANVIADARQADVRQADARQGSVWRIGRHGEPEELPVAIGLSDGTYTQILGGNLAAGDEVIIGQSTPASEGKRVSLLKF